MALEHNSRYIKALFRRAKAAELTNDLMQCLEGEVFIAYIQLYFSYVSVCLTVVVID